MPTVRGRRPHRFRDVRPDPRNEFFRLHGGWLPHRRHHRAKTALPSCANQVRVVELGHIRHHPFWRPRTGALFLWSHRQPISSDKLHIFQCWQGLPEPRNVILP